MSQVQKSISEEALFSYQNAFNSSPLNRIALNAVTKTSLKAVSINRAAVTKHNHIYSHTVVAGPSTSQHSSGRCWIFAGLNLFRTPAAEKMKLEDFELSQTYLHFYDKLEKSNYFLESILDTLDEPTDGRLISWIVRDPIQDGGQWDMFVNLVEKYGVVPKIVMPESESSSSTGQMNEKVTEKLREFACTLRRGHKTGLLEDALRDQKNEMLSTIYRMLCIHLGVPPQSF